MRDKPYKRRPGDLEIRILNNGKLVMIAPDERLIEIARQLEAGCFTKRNKKETKKDVRGKGNKGV